MALNEVALAIIVTLLFLGGGIYAGYKFGYADGEFEHYMNGWKAGFEEAKNVYYLDKKKLEEQENILISKENAGYSPALSELLMAYGVSRVTQLPRNVRETYRLYEKNFNIDLDTLIQRESEETVNDI